MTYLLDVNLLIALFDSRHVNHEAGHRWFGEVAISDWATCPTAENGCIRILSNPAYPTVTATPAEVMKRLAAFCESRSHSFWSDDRSIIGLLSSEVRRRMRGHRQVTDFYLVALAERQGGQLGTFDGSLVRSLEGTTLAKAIELVV